MLNRFGPYGLYLLDEPRGSPIDAELPYMFGRVHDLVTNGSQLIIATDSPLVLAYPEALVYTCDEDGLHPIDYEDAAPVRLTRSFLETAGRIGAGIPPTQPGRPAALTTLRECWF